MLPFELHNVSFHISRDFLRGTRQNLPQDPNVKYYVKYSTSNVADGDLSTCWHANRAIHSGDFFAIDFLSIQTSIIFTLAFAHSPVLQRNLDVSISLDGLRWISYRSLKGIFKKTNRAQKRHLNTFLFYSNIFNPGFQSFRYLSFKSIKPSDNHFRVCEIQTISERKVISVMVDYEQLKI